MNYRHIFHAGNRCDIVKHAVLTLVLGHLRAKDKGFAVLDTHAGVGLYDLNDPRAQKTGEATAGILRLLDAPPVAALADYYGVLRRLNPLWDGKKIPPFQEKLGTCTEDGIPTFVGTICEQIGFSILPRKGEGSLSNFRVYPGSPLIVFHMLREQDRLIACELHPEDAEALRLNAPNDKRMQIHRRDGYEAMGAFLPPPEKRGLVLIDPPYEQPDEFEKLVAHVAESYRRWATGIYMIWYPVKDRPAIWKFHDALAATGIGKILCAEFIYDETVRADRLSGSGMIIINPPWKLDEELNALFPALHQAMGTEERGVVVKWLEG